MNNEQHLRHHALIESIVADLTQAEQERDALRARVAELEEWLEMAVRFGLPEGQISREFDDVRKMRAYMFTSYRGEKVCIEDSLDALKNTLRELGLWPAKGGEK